MEKSVLVYMSELDLSNLWENSDELANELKILQDDIDKCSGEIDSLRVQLQRLTKIIKGTDQPPASIIHEIINHESKIHLKTNDLTESLKEHSVKSQSIKNVEQRHNCLKQLIEKMDNYDGDELFILRSNLAQEIKNIVEYIAMYNKGDVHAEKSTPPCYMIKFKNGSHRYVEPDINNPLIENIMIRKVLPPKFTSIKK